MDTEILVVEDEPADANLIRELFSDEYEIEIVGDTTSAVSTLQSLSARGECPQLLLVDLRLPDGSGFDVLRQIETASGTDDVSVVILSNSNADTDRDRARELGADGFETKPMDIDDFERTIAAIERKYLQVPE